LAEVAGAGGNRMLSKIRGKLMVTKRVIIIITLALLLNFAFLFVSPYLGNRAGVIQAFGSGSPEQLPGLQQRATVTRANSGVPHLSAANDHDVYFMMGYIHAQDRIFQMDVMRRQGNGTLAELLGAGPNDQILGDDVENRFFGAGRAASRSLSLYSEEAKSLVQAYADGVNAWVSDNPPPPEYEALEIERIAEWTPLDTITIVKLIQFQLSFDVSDLDRTAALLNCQRAGQMNGFDGSKLFFEDLYTVAPFDPIVTIPGQARDGSLTLREIQESRIQSQMLESAQRSDELITPETLETINKFLERYHRGRSLTHAELGVGSNWWLVAGSKTNSGSALFANDPHLGLGVPSTFYEIHLTVESHSSPMNVYGVSYPGVPGVFLGQNQYISWGATTCGLDVTDIYTERVVLQNGAPVATQFRGNVEPLTTIPEVYKVNQIQNGVKGDLVVVNPGNRPGGLLVPPATFIAPRRNNGALFLGGPTGALSIQFTGASGTRDLEGIFALARARNIVDFKRGLQYLEVGSLNWAYADVNGNIATFVNGKVPLREDLQAGSVDGLPPFFLRDGTGAVRNEWIPSAETGSGFNYESLPFEEMPQVVNPSQGFLINANNDPIGVTLDNNPLNQMRDEGVYYISAGFSPGFRAAKIARLLTEKINAGRRDCGASFEDMKQIQSNVEMLDAEIFTPYIIRAFDVGRSPGAPAELAALANDPAVQEAIGRLSNWDYSAPTGIAKGYDAGDRNVGSQQPTSEEIANSVAATIYTVWRSQILANTIAGRLQRLGLGPVLPGSDRLLVDLRFLLDNFQTKHGVGASGVDFFEIPGLTAPPELRRDGLILKSLKDALTLLAGAPFAAAFGGSTNQNDYCWGKLHRITFGHIFGGLAPQFSIPTAANFTNLSAALPGLSVDGGFETIDIGPFNIRGASSHAYTFGGGASRRYIAELRRGGIKSAQIIPGGTSGVLNNRFFANQLPLWLTNQYHGVHITRSEIERNRYSKTEFLPSR
jgi:penicillin amidase